MKTTLMTVTMAPRDAFLVMQSHVSQVRQVYCVCVYLSSCIEQDSPPYLISCNFSLNLCTLSGFTMSSSTLFKISTVLCGKQLSTSQTLSFLDFLLSIYLHLQSVISGFVYLYFPFYSLTCTLIRSLSLSIVASTDPCGMPPATVLHLDVMSLITNC